jgi:hypothetical protein
MEQKIIIPISPTLGGMLREVEWVGFSYWYHDKQEAEMLCKVWLLDDQGNRLQNVDIQQGRVVRIEISNRNKVDVNGLVIEPTDSAWENGIPEYDFYFGAFMLDPQGTPIQVISQALQVLENFNRFNRR